MVVTPHATRRSHRLSAAVSFAITSYLSWFVSKVFCSPWDRGASGRRSLDPEPLRVGAAEAQAVPGAVEGGDQLTAVRRQRPVEEHRLDAVVVVEVLHVAQVGHRGGHMSMQVGGAV